MDNISSSIWIIHKQINLDLTNKISFQSFLKYRCPELKEVEFFELAQAFLFLYVTVNTHSKIKKNGRQKNIYFKYLELN